MKLKKLILIIFFSKILLLDCVFAQENKILIKINNEIITTLDILNEINYLEAINNDFKDVDKNQAIEISKNSLIREKIKEIELLKRIKEISIEEKVLNNLLIRHFKRLKINSITEFNEYFTNKEINPTLIRKKISIELLWNDLIFQKFNKNINIDKELIKKELLKKDKKKEFLISEILFKVENNESLEEKFQLIKKTIKDKSFSQAVLLYSISKTSNNAGKLGWIKETSLNIKIKNKVKSTKIGDLTSPMVLPGGFLILKIEDQRDVKRDLNLDNEISLIAKEKTNEQLNQFSNIFFNKVKKDIKIYEL